MEFFRIPYWHNSVDDKCESPQSVQLMDARIEHFMFYIYFFASIDTFYLGFDKIYFTAWMVCWPSTIQKLIFLASKSVSFIILIEFTNGSDSLMSNGIRRASGNEVRNFYRNDFTNTWTFKSSCDLNLNTLGASLHLTTSTFILEVFENR